MAWSVVFSKDAKADFLAMDKCQQLEITKKLARVSTNPLPQREGGYGVELGKKHGLNLTGCLKIKLKKAGIRIVYTLERTARGMKIIVIGMREDLDVYKIAVQRLGRI